MAPLRILIVDDDASSRAALRNSLSEEGYQVSEAGDAAVALRLIAELSPEIVLSEMRVPGSDGLSLLRAAKDLGSAALFVMMTSFGTVNEAVELVRAGAETYLTKPLEVRAMLAVLDAALEKRSHQRERTGLREREREAPWPIVGDSPLLQAAFELVKRAAPTRATVLILGEAGAGKELFARAVHEQSPRRGKPFIKVSCALSESLLERELFGDQQSAFVGAVKHREGRFEAADGGTLFLDAIGELSPALQLKLLHVLQTGSIERMGGSAPVAIDVRVVAVTNRVLHTEVREGRFREDLYYRLNVVAVTLPPLRKRRADITKLAGHFVAKYADAHHKDVRGLAPEMLHALLSHDWPGNVRELESAIEHAVVVNQSGQLMATDLPLAIQHAPSTAPQADSLIPGATMARIERDAIVRTVEHCQGSTARAAEMLGISVRTVQYRLKEYAKELESSSAVAARQAG